MKHFMYNIFEKIKEENDFKVTEIDIKDLDKWDFNFDSLVHESGRFFSIEGIRVKTNFGVEKDWMTRSWDQPIINQSEIGLLGILVKKIKNSYYFLMQAKMEPGNINVLQLSPTVQATKSNFSRVHKGEKTKFLEYFTNRSSGKIWVDQLQSEQGGKFLKKRNRNMIVEIKEDIVAPPGFFWIQDTEMRNLTRLDNFVNMDARSVLSTARGIQPQIGKELYSSQEIMSWYIDQKVKYELSVEKIPIFNLKKWKMDGEKIFQSNDFFSVIGVKVEAGTREVKSWTQPMIKDTNIGLVGFIKKKINDLDHYLVQAKVMPGNIDVIDISPSVSVSNYKKSNVEFLEYFTEKEKGKIIFDVLQSEEGGRFYQLQNRNMVIEIPEDELKEVPPNYKWVTLNQLIEFMPMGMVNIESRSLISAL